MLVRLMNSWFMVLQPLVSAGLLLYEIKYEENKGKVQENWPYLSPGYVPEWLFRFKFFSSIVR